MKAGKLVSFWEGCTFYAGISALVSRMDRTTIFPLCETFHLSIPLVKLQELKEMKVYGVDSTTLLLLVNGSYLCPLLSLYAVCPA